MYNMVWWPIPPPLLAWYCWGVVSCGGTLTMLGSEYAPAVGVTLEKGKAMTSNYRERGAIGYVLDTDKLTEVMRQVTGTDNARPWGRPVLVYGQDKSWAVVNTEGVGGKADDYDTPARVWWERELGEDLFEAWINDDLVPFNDIQKCVTDEQVDLADHIRTFGARLDNNHAIWYEFADTDLATV